MEDIYKPKSVAILGVGAVGGFIASVLYKNNIDVTCIVKEKDVERLNKNGIQLESSILGNFICYPRVVRELDIEPDILFVTTKSVSLIDAITKIEPRFIGKTMIIPLLNGFEHINILRKKYGEKKVVAGSISIEVHKLGDKIFHSSSFSRIKLASNYLDMDEHIVRCSNWLSSLGIETQALNNEWEVIWEKLGRLNAIACLTALTDKPIGYLRSHTFWREKLEECIKESSAVAKAYGVSIDIKAVMNKIDTLDPSQLTSMQRDISLGNPSEIDAIPGAIIRAGTEKGITCPTIIDIFNQLKSKIANIKIN